MKSTGYIFHYFTVVLGLNFFGTPRISYCAESVFCILNFEYLSENQTKNETILIHWSVDQAGLNDEKTGGRKSCWTVPLIFNNNYALLYCYSMQSNDYK